MEATKEKKWHVYIAGNTEGPFSLEELRPRFAPGGGLDSATYAWCSGMGDWEVVTAIADFSVMLNPPPGGQKTSLVQLHPLTVEATRPVDLSPGSNKSPGQAGPKLAPAGDSAPKPAVKGGPSAPAKVSKRKVSRGFLGILLLLLVAGGGVFAGILGYFDPLLQNPAVQKATDSLRDMSQPLVFKLIEKVPAAGQFLSPLPRLEGISDDELEELKVAILGSPETDGARVAIALDRTSPEAPSFHLVSNLPDGAAFEVRVDSVPDRLLDQLSFSASLKGTLEKRVGRTALLRGPEGRALPKGEYVVYVYESDQQSDAVAQILGALPQASMKVSPQLPQGRKLIAKKIYFLGGVDDEAFRGALKTYLEQVVAKAAKEQVDVGQYKVNLEDRLKSSNAMYEKLNRLKATKSQQAQWQAFHAEWTLFYSQLQEAYQKWTPEVLQSEFYYGVLFQLVQQAGEAVFKVHGIHHGYFTGSVEKSSFAIQRGEALSQAEFALGALRSKLEQVEKLPKSPAGIPSREGL